MQKNHGAVNAGPANTTNQNNSHKRFKRNAASTPLSSGRGAGGEAKPRIYKHHALSHIINNMRTTFESEKGQKFMCHLVIAFLYDKTAPIVAVLPPNPHNTVDAEPQPLICGFTNQPLQGKIDFLSDNHDILTADIDELYKIITEKRFAELSTVYTDTIDRAQAAGLGFTSVSSIKSLGIQSIIALNTFVTEQIEAGNQRLIEFITRNRKDKRNVKPASIPSPIGEGQGETESRNQTNGLPSKSKLSHPVYTPSNLQSAGVRPKKPFTKPAHQQSSPETQQAIKAMNKPSSNKMADNDVLQKLKEQLGGNEQETAQP